MCTVQADSQNNVIRKIDLLTNTVTTLAGIGGVFGYNDGVGTSAQFTGPCGAALNSAGTFAIIVSVTE
jgi:DNA-binding beta-propeller fold protein YncE